MKFQVWEGYEFPGPPFSDSSHHMHLESIPMHAVATEASQIAELFTRRRVETKIGVAALMAIAGAALRAAGLTEAEMSMWAASQIVSILRQIDAVIEQQQKEKVA